MVSDVGRNSSVGIATRCCLDGPGIEKNPGGAGGGAIFRTRPDRPWDLPNLRYNEKCTHI
jgi:hypothetical protein